MMTSSSTAAGLTAEQQQFYETNGYILVQNVFTNDEAAELRTEVHEVFKRFRGGGREIDLSEGGTKWAWPSVRDTEPQRVILALHDPQFYSAAFTKMLLHPRLIAIAQSIIGPNVQLHHSKLFIKEAEKGASVPMHQDYRYFPHARHSVIGAFIHLDDTPLEKGCLRVVPGSHKLGPLQPDHPDHTLPRDRYDFESATPCPAKAGDVLYFSYFTIHASGVNTSQEARTTAFLQMRDPADSPTERIHESRGQGMMLAGIDPTCCADALERLNRVREAST